jgi:hypothetical protein
LDSSAGFVARLLLLATIYVSSHFGRFPDASSNIFANVVFRDKELGTKVLFADNSMIDDCQRPNSGQNKILRNLIPKRFNSNQKYFCRS